MSSGKQLLSAALGTTPNRITNRTNMFEEPLWDSLAHMRLVLSLEEYTGRKLNAHQIMEISNLEKIEQLLIDLK